MRKSSPHRFGHPTATYRLQLHAGFTFDDALAQLPYLDSLGISHLYVSPIFRAAPGSQHGYDVLDHSQVNPELGGLPALYRLGAELLSRDMGLVLDIVPNHVGIAGGANPWWRDVLRYGRSSRFANYFDIDWEAQPQMASGVLVFPVLGQPFGLALEAGELTLGLNEGDLAVRYFEHCFPLRPESYADVLGLPPLHLVGKLHDGAALGNLAGALTELSTGLVERCEPARTALRLIIDSEPAIRAHVEERLAAFNGTPGDPRSFDALEGVLLQQHYRLADWRVAASELNYRRFFDNNSLAAIRVENEDVFADTHGLLLQLVEQGIVTGVRVDHIDGLYDPTAYLRRLRTKLSEAAPEEAQGFIPIYVEKILEGDEMLPPEWPVDGTTGYEFLASVDRLMVMQSSEQAMSATYDGFTGARNRLSPMRYEAKCEVLDSAFGGEVSVLAYQLYRIGQRERRHRDNTLRAIRDAIASAIACLPVYRTYGPFEREDAGAAEIERAVMEAQGRNPELSARALSLLREVLLDPHAGSTSEDIAERIHFRRRLQQASGPIMAKGVEDTTFFRYNRLLSLNEVGAEPGHFGQPPERVHADFERRRRAQPHALLATSTHDTKRSEDVRARLSVLTEIPEVWRKEVNAWAKLNAQHLRTVAGEAAPDANTQYYLYQTLVGSWEGRATPEYADRIREHLLKATREAKQQTSWISPNAGFEDACAAFVTDILNPRRSRAFLRRLDALVARIAPAALHNSLSMLALKVFSPGVPDFYQGSEGLRLTLTDPDNRKPVDFSRNASLLANLGQAVPPGLADASAAKLWLTRALLSAAAECPAAVRCGTYAPVIAQGQFASNLFAFEREAAGERLVVVVPRLTHALLQQAGSLAAANWASTVLPLSGRHRSLLDGTRFEGDASPAALFSTLPVNVLRSEE